MRGYGDSERPEGVSSYHIDILIEDVRDLIRQLGKCHLVLMAQKYLKVLNDKYNLLNLDQCFSLMMLV